MTATITTTKCKNCRSTYERFDVHQCDSKRVIEAIYKVAKKHGWQERYPEGEFVSRYEICFHRVNDIKITVPLINGKKFEWDIVKIEGVNAICLICK